MNKNDIFNQIYYSIINENNSEYEEDIETDIEEENDGWDEDTVETFRSILNKIYDLQYELSNCKRGQFTSCKNKSDLASYVKELGDSLISAAEEIEE
jgi:hypothetical protein